jgi:hypothetical protein
MGVKLHRGFESRPLRSRSILALPHGSPVAPLPAAPARDDVVDDTLAVNAGDPHVRGIRSIRAREVAFEGAPDRCRDARRASHVGRSKARVLEDEVRDRLLGRVRSDRARAASRQQHEEARDDRARSPHARIMPSQDRANRLSWNGSR